MHPLDPVPEIIDAVELQTRIPLMREFFLLLGCMGALLLAVRLARERKACFWRGMLTVCGFWVYLGLAGWSPDPHQPLRADLVASAARQLVLAAAVFGTLWHVASRSRASLVCGLAVLLALLFLLSNVIGHRCQSQLTACKSNLRNLGTALVMYGEDNQGKYPATLSALVPNYLKILPNCPAAGMNTYSYGYRVRQAEPGTGRYTFFCAGAHHVPQGGEVGYPAYDSTQGLVDGPRRHE